MNDFNMPLCNSNKSDGNVPEGVNKFIKVMRDADILVFAIPEATGHYAAAFKNAMDWLICESKFNSDIAVDGARIRLRPGYQINIADWDPKKGFVKTYPGKSTNVLISRRLKEMELSIYEYLDQYRYGKPRLTFIELEEKLNQLIENPRTSFNKNKKRGVGRGADTVLYFFDYFIKDSETGVRLSPTK